MKMYVILKTQTAIVNEEEVEFDESKFDNPLVTHWAKTFGRYNYIAYLSDVTVPQAVAVVDLLANDPTVAIFTPLLEYVL